MTKFVLNEEFQDTLDKDLAEIHQDYARFLIQDLKWGMFIPCGENGDVLKYHGLYESYKNSGFLNTGNWETQRQCDEAKKYFEAKERVLFEGFMSVDTRRKGQIYFALKQSHRKNNIDYIMNDAFGLFFYNSSNERSRLNVVEDLLNFHELILTESAIKQFLK